MKGVHMKAMIPTLGLVLLCGFTIIGCYTQVASTRDDMFSDEYAVQQTETPIISDDSTFGDSGEYFDENGLPRDRYYLDDYGPTLSVSFGWGYYDPYWWGYAGWGYGGYWGYPGYGWGHYGYYPPYYCYYPSYSYYDGYGATRRTGSTRGSRDHRDVGGVRAGSVEPARSAGLTSLNLPTGKRNMSSGRTTRATKPKASTARRSNREFTTSRDAQGTKQKSVESKRGENSSRSSGQVRQPRRASTSQSGSEKAIRGNGTQPAVRSSTHVSPPSPPASSGARGGGGGRR